MSLRGAKSLRRKVQHIKRNLGDEVEDAVREGAEATAAEMQRNVASHNTVWRGNLYRSISADKRPTGRFARYSIKADVPYAAFVEFGTGARGDTKAPPRFQFSAPEHTPRLTQDITEWVMTKPVFFGPRTEEVAWAIARRISQSGTYAHPFMRPAWFRMKPAIVRDAGYAAKRVIRRA